VKRIWICVAFVIAMAATGSISNHPSPEKGAVAEKPLQKDESPRVIDGRIKEGETLFVIFKKYGLDLAELFEINEASASVHGLSNVSPDHRYKIRLDEDNSVSAFTYWIDDEYRLDALRNEEGFEAEKKKIHYDKTTAQIGVSIKDNLISSLGSDSENLSLALDLSDVFAWDLDFSSDLRKDDVFKIVVEECYRNGKFKKYGDVLCAEYAGADGKTLQAYRFESAGKVGYYDSKGRPLKKAFLKAPLSFRRISSGFSLRRKNPVLKIYRPHHGVDYAAPTGTPVSAIGSGTVAFAGRRGGYGNLIILKHWNGYSTYYGHLSRIGNGIRRGAKVSQGETIGYVGSTGNSTGPHLHFEIRVHQKPVNPVLAKIPRAHPLSGKAMARFQEMKKKMDGDLAAIPAPAAGTAEGPDANSDAVI